MTSPEQSPFDVWLEQMYQQLAPWLRGTDPVGDKDIGFMVEMSFVDDDGKVLNPESLASQIREEIDPVIISRLLTNTVLEYVVLRKTGCHSPDGS